jgi:Tol biopolymer transport system component
VERDLATGEVRELFSFGQDPWATFDVSPSPDRRFLASRSPGRGEAAGARARAGAFTNDSKSYIYLHTLATGESRKLWDAPFSRAFAGAPQWLPDNSGVIVTRYTDADLTRLEAWLVPADGAAPRKLDLGVQNLLPAGVRISPDGRHLLMMVGDRRDGEIQAIERIVPGPKR